MRWMLCVMMMVFGAAALSGCNINEKKNVDEKGDPIVENEPYQPTPDSRGGNPRPISSGDRPGY